MTSTAPVAPSPPDLPNELDGSAVPAALAGAEVSMHALEHSDLSGRDASRLHLLESRLIGVDASDVVLTDALLRDVEARDGTWANARCDRASLGRVHLDRLRLTGTSFAAAHIEDAVFNDCRIDLASFRFARLERVRFEECRMDETDFSEAKLESVVFEDCSLTNASWGAASLRRCEMRGCDLTGSRNPERLAGVRMPWPDVINAVGELAAAVGIEIVD
jgi:uncharacterized protein YjbI with pentapeptide repeats